MSDDRLSEDIPELKRALLNEKGAPEILPFKSSLVANIREIMQSQVTFCGGSAPPRSRCPASPASFKCAPLPWP